MLQLGVEVMYLCLFIVRAAQPIKNKKWFRIKQKMFSIFYNKHAAQSNTFGSILASTWAGLVSPESSPSPPEYTREGDKKAFNKIQKEFSYVLKA